MDTNTKDFSSKVLEEAKISDMLFEVYDALLERGYDASNQILGYLMSGDPGYISSYKGSRDKILAFDRTKILATILESYLEK